jgi:hypothetical protein
MMRSQIKTLAVAAVMAAAGLGAAAAITACGTSGHTPAGATAREPRSSVLLRFPLPSRTMNILSMSSAAPVGQRPMVSRCSTRRPNLR